MSEPFEMKAGDTLPVLAVTLIGKDDAPLDVSATTVTTTIRSAYSPYTPLISNGATAFITDGKNGQVFYQWVNGAQTGVPGDYLAEWYVSSLGKVQTIPGEDYTRITINPSLNGTAPPIVPVVSLGEIETAIGRLLTGDEAARADQLVQMVLAQVSLWLNRDLVPTTYANERNVIDSLGRLRFQHGPVRSVSSVALNGSDPVTDYNTDWFNVDWLVPGYSVVTYTAGDDQVHPAAKGVILEAVARTILAGSQVGLGVIGSYSVEGTSISYNVAASTNTTGGIGRIPMADLSSLARLRRVVVG